MTSGTESREDDQDDFDLATLSLFVISSEARNLEMRKAEQISPIGRNDTK